LNQPVLVVISRDLALKSMVEGFFGQAGHVVAFNSLQSALDYIYNGPPNLVVIDLTEYESQTVDVLNNLKGDPMFSQLPVLAVIADGPESPQVASLPVEDYVRYTDLERDMSARIDLCIARSRRIVEVNPLTRLPGNISINREIQERIDGSKVFAVAYGDLDHFKPFNDFYGFSRGDEVIRVTGRLILNIVRNKQPQDGFVGHIGGDDFIYLVDVDLVEAISNEIIGAFDRIIPTFYDKGDREKGYITSRDRLGKVQTFPMVAISIGVAHNRSKRFSHYGEMTEVASEMKRFAKTFKESCLRIDMRQ